MLNLVFISFESVSTIVNVTLLHLSQIFRDIMTSHRARWIKIYQPVALRVLTQSWVPVNRIV